MNVSKQIEMKTYCMHLRIYIYIIYYDQGAAYSGLFTKIIHKLSGPNTFITRTKHSHYQDQTHPFSLPNTSIIKTKHIHYRDQTHLL